jgi:hypothetical protein
MRFLVVHEQATHTPAVPDTRYNESFGQGRLQTCNGVQAHNLLSEPLARTTRKLGLCLAPANRAKNLEISLSKPGFAPALFQQTVFARLTPRVRTAALVAIDPIEPWGMVSIDGFGYMDAHQADLLFAMAFAGYVFVAHGVPGLQDPPEFL